MKKILRLALITVLVLSLCLCLTGCNMIKEMRAAHGILQEDGAILLGGEEYIELPISQTLAPRFAEDYAYVTAADVPVLLSGILGEAHLISRDGVFLLNDEDYSLESIYYCRRDKYDAVKEQIENGFTPVGYMYTYEMLTDPDMFETETKEYTLSVDEVQALEAVRADVIPATVFSEIQSSYVAEIYLCSEDTYFKQYLCEF